MVGENKLVKREICYLRIEMENESEAGSVPVHIKNLFQTMVKSQWYHLE